MTDAVGPTLDEYITLVDLERERRPAEARLVDEILRLRRLLEHAYVVADSGVHLRREDARLNALRYIRQLIGGET